MNEPKKLYHEPMHTCEHILNQTMVRMFDCGRAVSAHIERKKSKCDYLLEIQPTDQQIAELILRVNEVIDQHLPVLTEYVSKSKVQHEFDLSRLPDDASDMLRIVRVGDYDACPCIGQHVENTNQLGRFAIISHDFQQGKWRLRFKLIEESER